MKRYRISSSVILTIGIIITTVPTVLSAQMTWNCVTPSAQWSARWAQSLLVFHDTMWIIGGDSWRITVNNVWFSTDGDSWICATASAPWPVRSGMGSFVYDDKMWITGGFYWTGSYWAGLGDVWWSSDGINWTQATDSAGWAPRGIHTAVVFHDTMWVIGGCNNTSIGPFYNDVWFSTDGVSWVCATDSAPWLARGGHTSVVFHDSMWVIGGWECCDVWCSNDGRNWTCAQSSVPWGVRYGRASVVFQDMIWQMAGYNVGTGFFNDVWYSADGSNWLEARDSAPWVPRHFPASVVYNNKIWLMGGTTNYVSGLNDVWNSTGLGIEETTKQDVADLMPEIYPNPAKSFLAIRWTSTRFGQTADRQNLKIFDLSGKLIRAVNNITSAQGHKQEMKVSLQEINPGIYFIQIGNETKTTKLVVTK